MKAEELMVGDLLRINRDGLCIKKDTIVQIRGIDGDNKFEEKGLMGCAGCQPLDETQFAGGIWLDYLDPIPLTPKILEKNGFGRGSDNLFSYGRGMYVMMWSKGHYSVGKIFGNWSAFVEFAEIRFIHELQHALRLCGIDKEIFV